MSSEVVFVTSGQGEKRSKRNPPPVRLKPFEGSFEGENFEQLPESGPEHFHAPVFVPPGSPESVIKEYDIQYKKAAHDEAKRMNMASGYMPDVYGVYVDEPNKKVYIHMQKLEETVMARIQRLGIYFLYENDEREKFEALWDTTQLYDDRSMCRVDNMMYDDENNLKFIDAEKAKIIPGGLSDRNKNSMKRCFLTSAVEAHLVYLARGIDLNEMGKLYYETGDLLYDSKWLQKNLSANIGHAILKWFNKGYQEHYLSFYEEATTVENIVYETYNVNIPSGYSPTWSLKTPFLSHDDDLGRNTFVTIRLREPGKM